MQNTRWDHGLTVTGEGQGLVGHAGAVLLRKLADQAGLTAALGSALARKSATSFRASRRWKLSADIGLSIAAQGGRCGCGRRLGEVLAR